MKRMIIILYGIIILGFTACSHSNITDSSQTMYTYIPEYTEIAENSGTIRAAFLCRDVLIYETYTERENNSAVQTFYALSLSENDEDIQPIDFQFPYGWGIVADIIQDSDGNYYILELDSTLGITDSNAITKPGYCVGKYDPEGRRLARWNITDWLLEDGGELQAQDLAMDGMGNLYVRGQNSILLMDSEGHYQGKITEQNILYMTCGADGSIYYYSLGMLKRLDYQTAESQTIGSHFPTGIGMCLGDEQEIWVYDVNGIYRHNTESQMPELLFNWLDMDVNASDIAEMIISEDGQIRLLLYDIYNPKAQSLTLVSLRKTEVVNVSKETITVGVMTITDNLRTSAIRFNQEHPQYHVQLKEYMGLNGYQNYEDAAAALNMDLVTGKAVDIIPVGYTELEKYLSKDLLEDLYPYLNASEALSAENLVDIILEAYTFDNKLVALPSWFRLEVIAGRQSQVGAQSSWSIADMITFFDQYQDDRVLQSLSPNDMLEVCLKCNLGYFINRETKECHFDSEEFLQILQFADRFTGEDDGYGWQRVLQENDQLLLYKLWCVTPDFAVEIPQWFENDTVNYIGYPTMDGSSGILLETSEDAYGILTTSAHKDIAWEFLESVILAEGEKNDTFDNTYGIFDTYFPIMKDKLELQLTASTENPYMTDAQGELLLDQDGAPIRRQYGTTNYVNLGIVTVNYIPLQEEVEQVRKLIRQARTPSEYQETVMSIILEESAGYFNGDREAAETAEIIQNRVQVYLNEK